MGNKPKDKNNKRQLKEEMGTGEKRNLGSESSMLEQNRIEHFIKRKDILEDLNEVEKMLEETYQAFD